MFRRTSMIILTALAVALLLPASALAWTNGGNAWAPPSGPTTASGDAFATHDWLLSAAINEIEGVAANGLSTSVNTAWIDQNIAFRATDDPDTSPQLQEKYGRPWNHVFSGSVESSTNAVGGGPDIVTYHYYRALSYKLAGNNASASVELGLLAHYLADLTVPYHAVNVDEDNDYHAAYEYAVGVLHSSMKAKQDYNREWLDTYRNVYRGSVTALKNGSTTNIRAHAVAASAEAATYYENLNNNLKTVAIVEKSSEFYEGSLKRFSEEGTSGVQYDGSLGVLSAGNTKGYYNQAVTRKMLTRSTWEIVRVIQAISNATTLSADNGFSLPVLNKVEPLYIQHRYQKPSGEIMGLAWVKDAWGKPVVGAKVTFVFDSDGYVSKYTTAAYTGTDGIARQKYKLPWNATPMRVHHYTAQVDSCGTKATKTDWYIPVKAIGDNTSTKTYLSADIPITTGNPYEHRAAQNSVVTANVKALDTSGKPIVGLSFTFEWKWASGAKSYQTAVTNSLGIATVTKNIGSATLGRTVTVTAQTYAGGLSRSTYTTVIPAIPVGTMKTDILKTTYNSYEHYPSQNTYVTPVVTILDPAGKPVANRSVTFEWKYANGTKVYITKTTNSSGKAWFYKSVGNAPFDKAITVTARFNCGGFYRQSYTTFSPRINVESFKALVGNSTPYRNTSVSVYAWVKDIDNKGMAGRTVKFVWPLTTGTKTTYAVTDSTGRAKSTLNIGATAKGVKVSIAATTPSKGALRNSTTSFFPK